LQFVILKLYNTLSRATEEFHPLDPAGKKVRMYACGPTVYNFAHIGNFRTFVSIDLLRRALKHFGYNLEHVMNITDVDDKTIKGAKEAKLALKDFTRKFTEEFRKDLATLKIESPEKEPAATDHIPQMVDLIAKLIEKGYAYVSPEDGSVYYRVEKFAHYGCLSHLDREGLKPGARVSQDEYAKESFGDFVLWKKRTPEDGDNAWPSPWGEGRPGWHIECSAMSMELLGAQMDIHCGGGDLMFPHHENEIAQSEAVTGKQFVKYWIHGSHLLVDGKKMAKSAGNFYTLRDVLAKGYSGREIRYALMVAHYRQNLNFTWQGMDDARAALARIDEWRKETHAAYEDLEVDESIEIDDDGLEFLAKFRGAIANDLNLPEALGHLFDYIRQTRKSDHELWPHSADLAWRKADEILGLGEANVESIPATVASLRDARAAARAAKDFKKSDDLRKEIEELGWKVKDTAKGQELSPA
jgi:cysteinyl-tRNA synthetase